MAALEWSRNEMYFQAITVIEAQECLIRLQIADYPNMKREQRRKTHREFHKMAYPKTHDTTEILSTEELGKRIKAAMNV